MSVPIRKPLPLIARGLVVCILSLIVLSDAMWCPARAQSALGPFQAASPWYGTGFSTGVATDGTTISVDTNGNGILDPSDHSHPHPAAIVGATLRLTPSRTVLQAILTGTGACTGGAETFFYAIPAIDGDPLVPLTGSICIPNQIAAVGFFDQPGVYEQRIGFVADQVPLAGSTQDVLWVDLETGVFAWNDFAFDQNLGFVQFSPSGIAAFVQHDISDGDNLANYSVIELCPGNLGHTYNPAGGTLQQLGPVVASATVIDAGGGNLVAEVHWPDNATVQATVPINDCTGSTPAVGACCLPDGGCLPGVTAGDCSTLGGTYEGDGTDCATATCPPPPSPELALTKSGPASVLEGNDFTYTLQYDNTGDLDSGNAQIIDNLPAQVTFVSATGGGNYEAGSHRVVWLVGPIGAGTSAQVDVTVTVPCGAPQITNDNYTLFAFPGGFIVGSPSVTTNVVSQSGAAVNVLVSSTPQAPVPLGDLDQILHEITLVNTAAAQRESLTTTIIGLGTAQDLVQVVDDGGGVVTTYPSGFSWLGNIAPSDSVTVSVLTEIDECRTPSIDQTQLNSGSPIRVFNACGVEVGTSAPADIIGIRPPPILVEVIPLDAGPPVYFDAFLDGLWMALVRGGSSLQFEARIHNTEGVSKSVSLSLPFPADFDPIGNPPFIGTPPAGTAWDDPSRTISWSGAVPGNTSVIIPFAAMVDSAAGCQVPLITQASSGACTNNISGTTHLLVVPPPPSGDHVFGTFPYGNARWIETDSLSTPETVLCPIVEVWPGVGRNNAGDIYMAGLPSLRFNPQTLDLRFFDPFSWGIDAPVDVTEDPQDGTSIWQAQETGTGMWTFKRYDAVNDLASTIWADTTGQHSLFPGRFLVDLEHRIAAIGGSEIVQIDLDDPSNVQTWPTPSPVSAIALDTDGDYLLTEATYGLANPRRMWKMNRSTGEVTEEFADLTALIPSDTPHTGMEVSPEGLVYLVSNTTTLIELARADSTIRILPLGSPITDIVFFSGSVTAVDEPRVVPPRAVTLNANVPNPFNPQTSIRYELPRDARIRVRIFDLRGRLVVTLVEGMRPAGRHAVTWHGRDRNGTAVASGIYLVRLESGNSMRSRKITLVR